MEVEIDAKDMHYKELNEKIHQILNENPDIKKIILKNVLGQRFIGNGIQKKDLTIEIYGIPGGDLGMFMSGPIYLRKFQGPLSFLGKNKPRHSQYNE